MESDQTSSHLSTANSGPSTPMSSSEHTLDSTPRSLTTYSQTTAFKLPSNMTQDMIEANPKLKRLQQDLLILTSFNDNISLCWRPFWFQAPFPSGFQYWTLHNPPHVVTERYPGVPFGRQLSTRRMRRKQDAPPLYLKTQTDWERYCDLYGIPHDFLCEDQIRLLRLGLLYGQDGPHQSPPSWPLYPEPQPIEQGDYILHFKSCKNLPRKYRSVDPDFDEYGECIIVQSGGALKVERLKGPPSMRIQGPGQRWSYIPWTDEQARSCEPQKLRLRFFNSAMQVI